MRLSTNRRRRPTPAAPLLGFSTFLGGTFLVVVAGLLMWTLVMGDYRSSLSTPPSAVAPFVLGILCLGVASVLSIVEKVRRFAARPVGGRVLRRTARLLPRAARTRYLEEWAGELYDMRADGDPWWRRAEYVAGILCRALPVLAVRLRLRPQQAVD